MVPIAVHEFLMSVDDFNQPKILEDAEAIMVLLVRLLILEPGTFETHPNMGVGLLSKYRYDVGSTDRSNELKLDFQQQISTYLPWFQSVTINVVQRNFQYNISAEIDNNIYEIYYDSKNKDIKKTYRSLSSI